MNILITYSSVTGNTTKLAEGIYRNLTKDSELNIEIDKISLTKNIEKYDAILVGYWVDKGAPNKEAEEFMKTIKNKKVGIFATLGAYPDSSYAFNSLLNGEEIIKEDNEVIGKYICQGAVSPKLIEIFKKLDSNSHHSITDEKLKRYKIAALHPNESEIKSAAILFKERLTII
ncbi:flavodoxin family protein [Clostridium septicum]|uniref:flavodoxin family protein n=1 Tax=Clostridium septicum TaxID=1504 RepID=UPI000FF8EF4B|nr:flavodoxin family protein [Clostridium septicum]QAS60347.1 flavodoxin [Clostridium septicum]